METKQRIKTPINALPNWDLIPLLNAFRQHKTVLIASNEEKQVLEKILDNYQGEKSYITSNDILAGNKVWILYNQPGIEEIRDTFTSLKMSGILGKLRMNLDSTFAQRFVNQLYLPKYDKKEFSKRFEIDEENKPINLNQCEGFSFCC